MTAGVSLESIQLSPGNSFTIKNAVWQQYEDLVTYLDQNSLDYRVSYFDYTIELMSPDRKHENPKERLADMVREYCRAKKIRYYSCGSADIKKPKIAGKQPDSSFCFGTGKDMPDLVIEIINTSGSIKKLHQIYLEFGIQELWIWKNDQVSFYQLQKDTYELINESINLLGLSVDLVNQCLSIADEWDASQEFRKLIS